MKIGPRAGWTQGIHKVRCTLNFMLDLGYHTVSLFQFYESIPCLWLGFQNNWVCYCFDLLEKSLKQPILVLGLFCLWNVLLFCVYLSNGVSFSCEPPTCKPITVQCPNATSAQKGERLTRRWNLLLHRVSPWLFRWINSISTLRTINKRACRDLRWWLSNLQGKRSW